MNLNQLKYFNTVAEQGSVSKAAELLHISQPSLSAAIKELEEEFGTTLFNRHYRGVALTREGNAFYKMSSDIIKSAERCETTMRDMGMGRKILRLGVPPMIGSVILPHIYNNFLKVEENISLETAEGGYRELLYDLENEKVDLAFLPHTSPLPSELSSVTVGKMEIVCCTAENNPITELESVNPKNLSKSRLVLFENSFFQSKSILDWFKEEKITPNVLLRTEQLSTVISMVKKSDAVGFLYRELAADHPELKFLPTEKPMNITVSLVWKTDKRLGNSMRQFIKFIGENNPLNQTD